MAVETSAELPATHELPPRRRRPSLDAGLATIFGLAAVVIGLIWRSVPLPGDPWSYVRAAHDFPGEHWNAVGYARYGLILPLAAIERLFSVSQATEYIVPLVAAAVCAAFVYLAVRLRVGRWAAIGAASLTVGNSLVGLTLTRVYPDLPSTAAMVVAVYLALLAADEGRVAPDMTRRLLILLIGVGFFVGLSYEIRETVVFEWPILAYLLLRYVGWRRSALPVVVPAVGWLVAELLINHFAHGDAFVRLRALTGADIAGNGVAQDQAYLGHGRLHYLVLIPRTMLHHYDLAPLLAIGAIALIGGIVYRGTTGLFTVWAALAAGGLIVFGGVLHPAHPSIRQDIERYWIAFEIPMFMAACAAAAHTARLVGGRLKPVRTPGPQRTVAAALVTVVLLAWPLAAFGRWLDTTETLAPNGGNAMEMLRGYLTHALPKAPAPKATIWASSYTKRLLQFYDRGPFGGPRWTATVHVLNTANPPAPGDWIVMIDHGTCTFCVRGMSAWTFGKSARTSQWTIAWKAPRDNVVVYRQG